MVEATGFPYKDIRIGQQKTNHYDNTRSKNMGIKRNGPMSSSKLTTVINGPMTNIALLHAADWDTSVFYIEYALHAHLKENENTTRTTFKVELQA